MKIMAVGRNVVIPKEFHEEIRKISQETGDTIRSVIAGILSRANEKSLFNPTTATKIKQVKSLNSGNPPEDNGDAINEIDKSPEEIKKHEQEKEKKEKTGEGGKEPIPEDKENKMQEQDMEVVKQIVNTLKEGIDTKLGNQERAYEQGIKNLGEKIDTLAKPGAEATGKVTPSLTAQDVEGMLDKRDTRRAEAEATRLRKADDTQKAKDAEEARKQAEQRLVNLECSLNPEKPECQKLMKLLGVEVLKGIKPDGDKDEKGGGTPKEPKTPEQVIAEVVNGLKLSEMKPEVRKEMKPEELDGRTTDAAKLVTQLNITPVDMLNVLESDPRDKKGIAVYVAGDPELAEEVLKRAEVKAKIEGCNLGDEKQCKLADEILNESNLALVRKAEKGKRYHFVNPKLGTGTGF